jgi:ADP-ribose pyrophosphatase YjhB (NUDIX family)
MIDDGHLNGARVLLIDDLLATGGTARAGVDLARELGATMVGISFFTELPHLGGRAKLLDVPVHSLVSVIEDEPLVGVEYCVDALATDRGTGELLLVDRLDGLGIAMPGGRIEAHESIIDAVHRELSEEANCPILEAEYLGTLVGSNRDPRGPKVSTVLRAETITKEAMGETGKTEVRRVLFPSDLPPPTAFAFDHGPFVHKHWREPSLAFV